MPQPHNFRAGQTYWRKGGDRREVSVTLKSPILMSQTSLVKKYQKTFRLSPSSVPEFPRVPQNSLVGKPNKAFFFHHIQPMQSNIAEMLGRNPLDCAPQGAPRLGSPFYTGPTP